MQLLHSRKQGLGVHPEHVREDPVAADAPLERARHGLRLLVDLFQHVVAILAALDSIGREVGYTWLALHRRAMRIEHGIALARDLDDVALVQVDEAVGDAKKRLHIRAQEVLADADAHHQGTPSACANEARGLVGGQDRDGIGSVQALRCSHDGRAQIQAALQQRLHQVGDDLGVGLRSECVPACLKLFPQFGVVLDDAVVDDRHPIRGHMRVRVVGAWHPMGRPAGVGDTDLGCHRLLVEKLLEVTHLAFGAAALQPALFKHGKTGGVVPAILQGMQAGDQDGADIALGYSTNDSTHGFNSAWGAGARSMKGAIGAAILRLDQTFANRARQRHRPYARPSPTPATLLNASTGSTKRVG